MIRLCQRCKNMMRLNDFRKSEGREKEKNNKVALPRRKLLMKTESLWSDSEVACCLLNSKFSQPI